MTGTVHLRRLRLLTAALLAATSSVAVVACGGATFEDEAATTTAPAEQPPAEAEDGFSPEAVQLGEDLLAGFDIQPGDVDELESGCLGFALIDALGETDARGVVTTEDPPPEQLAALEAGFDACISGTTLGPAITALFFSEFPGAPSPDQSVVSCVAGEIDGTTGQLIIGLFDSSETGSLPTEFLDTLDVCVPDQVVADLFAEALVSDGTVDPVQAACIAEQVAPQLSISTLAAAGQADGLPADVQALIEEATLACIAGG